MTARLRSRIVDSDKEAREDIEGKSGKGALEKVNMKREYKKG